MVPETEEACQVLQISKAQLVVAQVASDGAPFTLEF